MKRGLLVAVGGAAIVVAGLSGCSSGDKSSSSSSSASSRQARARAHRRRRARTADSGAGGTKVTIDGQDQNVTGTVVCAVDGRQREHRDRRGDHRHRRRGQRRRFAHRARRSALATSTASPSAVGPGAGDAKAEKDGKTYKISGNATGIDMANPMTPVTKPFELEVTCP